MYGYIYRITDLANGKCYIGQHKYDKPMLDPKYHGSSRIIKNQIRKHPENFLEEIIFIAATSDELNYFETYFIEHLNTLYPNGYNLNTGGDKYALCEESKQKLRVAKKGRHHTEETKAKISASKKDQPLTEETKQKMSEAKKGKVGPNKGKHFTEEWKQRMREVKKGKNNPNYKFHITTEELYDLYIVQGLSTYKIAKIYGCSHFCIWRKIKELTKKP